MAQFQWRVDVKRTRRQEELLEKLNNNKTKKRINQIVADAVTPFVPYDTGKLRKNIIVGPVNITWTEPYARYQYYGEVYGPNFPITRNGQIVGWFSRPKPAKKHPTGRRIQYHYPGTGSHWVERVMKKPPYYVKNKMQRDITNELKRIVKEMGIK